jgi:putative peptidoglycan lipid II flippase
MSSRHERQAVTAEPTPGLAAARPIGLLRSVATVGSLTLVSRVLGFVRDIMIAALLGAGPLADAFFVAFKLPNFLRRLFAEGAFNAGFVPMFASTLEADGEARARAFAAEAQAVLLAILVPLVLLAIPAMPWVIRVLAPGFEVDGQRYDAAIELTRITFGYILFISLVALYGGMLNSLGRFAAPAASPVVLNLALIAALVLSALWLDMPAQALAWAVAAAGLLQFLLLRASLARRDMAPPIARPRLTRRIRSLFARIAPGVIGGSAQQISSLFDVFFASLLAPGAISYLYFADRLYQLPLGVIGVAVGTALLPLLARQIRAGNLAAASHSQNRALEIALLLTLPSTAGLVVLAEPIVTVLFERGAFDAAASLATARAVIAYALGLPAYVLIKVLAPGFFARGDTVTPVKIAIGCIVANLLLMVALIGPLEHVGIALATALSAWLNAALLATLLHRAGRLAPDARLRRRLSRLVLATSAMALGLWLARPWVAPLHPILGLLLLIAAGGLGFLLLARISGGFDLAEVRTSLAKRRP